ncbi:MAG TPA: D-2-hydroxyacid dehydrogenase [Bacillota bacterium]|nr:D-2-hydroxyacid dehydrogenase [Bacillota bacterium]HPL53790.1 D-2-hydroxyacid dehydrogenase [Bacillota bacterium]
MKIVVLDGYTLNPGDLSWEGIEGLGELKVYDRTPEDKVLERIIDADAVFTNKTPVSKDTIAACPKLKYIGVLATGYNIVDVEAARERNIPVSNIPVYGTAAVAQMVFALLLEICHHTAAHSDAVHKGDWANNPDWCFWNYPLIELAGKTMGVIGLGRIGQNTARIAAAFGMKVLAYDEHESDLGRKYAEYVSLDELLEQSDVIALHCPLFPSTQGIINKNSIAKMKNGVIIINNSRGPLIVEQDLTDALNSGKVYAAGIDVVSTEPIREDNPLLQAKNCFITPHISWAPKESRERLMNIATENLKSFIDGKPANIVN